MGNQTCRAGGALFWQMALTVGTYHPLTGFMSRLRGPVASGAPRPHSPGRVPEGGKGAAPRPSEGWSSSRGAAARPGPAQPAALPSHGAGGPVDRAAEPRGEEGGRGGELPPVPPRPPGRQEAPGGACLCAPLRRARGGGRKGI